MQQSLEISCGIPCTLPGLSTNRHQGAGVLRSPSPPPHPPSLPPSFVLLGSYMCLCREQVIKDDTAVSL